MKIKFIIKIIIGIIVAILIVVGGIWLGAHKKSVPAGKEVIKIGFIGPLTGELALWGENQKSGIELASEQINKQGGINGLPVKVIYEDSQCDPKNSVSAIKKLIEIDGVKAIIGDTCSSAVLAIAPIAEEKKIPLIAPIAAADQISEAGDYIFRNFVTNSKYGIFAGKQLKQEGKNTVAVIYLNNDYGKNLAEDFFVNYEANGGKIVFDEGYNNDVKDFRTLLTKAKDKNPDVIFLAGYYPDGAIILKQAEELNIRIEFFGGGDAYDDLGLVSLAGKASENFRFLSIPMGGGPTFGQFSQTYKAKYSKEPPVYSDYAYDAFMVMVGAIRKAGLDTTAIKNALYETDYAGASDMIRFDEKGDIINPKIIIKIIKDSKIVIYKE